MLRQCRHLLARLDAIPIDTHDTAYAAFRVKEAGGPRAAVCSEEAALEAGLLILEEDVSDVRPNTTRFWKLARAGATADAVPGEDAAPDAPAPRVVFYAGVRASSALAEAGAELLSLPGTPARSGPRLRGRAREERGARLGGHGPARGGRARDLARARARNSCVRPGCATSRK